MRRYVDMMIFALLVLAQVMFAGAEQEFVLSTTADFTTWSWNDGKKSCPEYYPVGMLECRIRELAEAGIGKLYLRVSVRGLSLYPSKVTKMYGQDDLFHWQIPANGRRLTETLRRYDPCREIIRLGHKYGMQVWAWESVFEDGGLDFFIPKEKKYLPLAAKMHFDAMSNPAFVDHPEYFVMRDPKLNDSIDEARLKVEEQKCLREPITKIEIVGRDKRAPLRFTANDLIIMTSDDNRVYSKYKKPFKFRSGVNTEGYNYVTLDKLDFSSPYVKIGLKKAYPKDADKVTLSISREAGVCRAYNGRNEEIPTSWGLSDRFNSPLRLDPLSRKMFAWDYGTRAVGFHVTKFPEANKYIRGIAELCVPAVMDHKVKRFEELAEYPFDGFMLNLRSHCGGKTDDFRKYGYNPEVRKKVLERYGKDIWKNKNDRNLIDQVRGEAFATFLKQCKTAAGKRPVYLSGLPPADSGWDMDDNIFSPRNRNIRMYSAFLHYPIPYRRMLADGSVDGVNMVGTDFSNYLKGLKRDIRIGIFREGCLIFTPLYPGYDLFEEIQELKKSGKYDEVELYEAAFLTPASNGENLGKIRKIMKK